jgi:hypothetical protein
VSPIAQDATVAVNGACARSEILGVGKGCVFAIDVPLAEENTPVP